MTMGKWLFYGGIAGMVLVFVTAVVILSVMARQRRRLRGKLDAEYGKQEHDSSNKLSK